MKKKKKQKKEVILFRLGLLRYNGKVDSLTTEDFSVSAPEVGSFGRPAVELISVRSQNQPERIKRREKMKEGGILSSRWDSLWPFWGGAKTSVTCAVTSVTQSRWSAQNTSPGRMMGWQAEHRNSGTLLHSVRHKNRSDARKIAIFKLDSRSHVFFFFLTY